MNPFDLSGIATEGENELGQKLLSLHTLFKLMLGDLNPTEEAVLDRALIETYRIKGINTDPETQRNKEPPVMEDLYKVLRGGDEPEARSMAERLEKYIRGSLAGIFDQQSTIDINTKMMVFSTRNLEDVLRPIAYYIILDFVWTRIKKDLKKRILIVEEAWSLLQNDDSARFIYGVAKRARKYYLGLTTISQDVDDFLRSEYGKAIVTNSALQMLLKQHPAAIDRVAETFYLSEGEKRLLLSADLGEGLFFAGPNHVSIKVRASDEEHKLITTNPKELLKLKEEREEKKAKEMMQQQTSFRQMPPSQPQSVEDNNNDETPPSQDSGPELKQPPAMTSNTPTPPMPPKPPVPTPPSVDASPQPPMPPTPPVPTPPSVDASPQPPTPLTPMVPTPPSVNTSPQPPTNSGEKKLNINDFMNKNKPMENSPTETATQTPTSQTKPNDEEKPKPNQGNISLSDKELDLDFDLR
jgi:hypothetical protein